MINDIDKLNSLRVEIQTELDSKKTQKERNIMGQFATPYPLACDIMKMVESYCPKKKTSFLEPSIGLGAFYAAFKQIFGVNAGHALGYEIDKDYYEPSLKLWDGYDLVLRNEDFLLTENNSNKFDLIVANPPYIRHHYIDSQRKSDLQNKVFQKTGIKISGLAGLYCYFMLLSTSWIKDGGLSCWLIPSEFMDVNYGKAVKQFLLEKVELLRIHRFEAEDTQFDDALVSSTIVLFRNTQPSKGKILFTKGPSVYNPSEQIEISRDKITPNKKWSLFFKKGMASSNDDKELMLGNFFNVKRGIATGDNSFFIVDEDTIKKYCIPMRFLKPVLPSPRYVKDDIVYSDDNGDTQFQKRQYLFSCKSSKDFLRKNYPGVLKYIEEGEAREVNKGYICSKRIPWYSCEDRKPAPIVVPYMGRSESRKNLFRFILNKSNAVTTNVYLLLYPNNEYAQSLKDPKVLTEVWEALNDVPNEELTGKGREYGGGLHKLEPKELLNVQVTKVASVLLPIRKVLAPTFF